MKVGGKFRVCLCLIVPRLIGLLAIHTAVLQVGAHELSADVCQRSGMGWITEDPEIQVGDTPHWPAWRGPLGNNHSLSTDVPTSWNTDQNIIWKIKLPGRGHSSPCIVGDQIFITSAEETRQTQFLLCYRAHDGSLLWRRNLHQGVLPSIHINNSHASATACYNSGIVATAFVNDGTLWASGVTLQGRVKWQTKIGRFEHANGFGASPAIFRNLIILASDNQAEPQLVALESDTGALVWRTERPKSDNSGTPIVGTIAGRPQLILNGAFHLVSYNPATGQELWKVSHGTEVTACTSAFDTQRVVASGNVPEKHLASVLANGRGDVTGTHISWQTNRLNPYVPSPLIANGRLYLVLDSGTAYCRNLENGDVIWRTRLGGTFFSSPILVSGKIYVTNTQGQTYVFRATDEFELLSVNEIREPCYSTPAVVGNRIFLRTLENLFCIGNP